MYMIKIWTILDHLTVKCNQCYHPPPPVLQPPLKWLRYIWTKWNGCVPQARIWVFSKIFKIQLFLLLYYSACKKALMLFLWVIFGYWDIKKQIWAIEKKIRISFFSKTPKTVLLISLQLNIAQRAFYCLYSIRTAGYPFLQAE